MNISDDIPPMLRKKELVTVIPPDCQQTWLQEKNGQFDIQVICLKFADPTAIEHEFPISSHSQEEIEVIQTGPRQFMMTRSTEPFAVNRIGLGDEIETESMPDGTHRLLRIVSPKRMKHYAWVAIGALPPSIAICNTLRSVGGEWEFDINLALYAHVPLEKTSEFEAILTSQNLWPEGESCDWDKLPW